MTLKHLILSALLLPACDDKPDDTAEVIADDTASGTVEETTEETSACIAGDMAGDWSGYAFGNETVPQTIHLDDVAELGEPLGMETLDGSYYGEGFFCTFSLPCMAGSDEETLILGNTLLEEYPAGSCSPGIYHLSLMSADELLVQIFDEEGDEAPLAEGVLTR